MKASVSISRKIAKATELNSQIKTMQAHLDALKADIRLEAQSQGLSAEKRMVELECPIGVAAVSYVEDRLDFVKDSSPYDLRTLISPLLCSRTIKEISMMVMQDDAVNVYLREYTDAERKASSSVLEYKVSNPRIVLPKIKG